MNSGKRAKTRNGRYKSYKGSRGRKRPLSSIIESDCKLRYGKKCTEAGRSNLRVHRLENRETRWKFQPAGDLKRQKRKVAVIEVAEGSR